MKFKELPIGAEEKLKSLEQVKRLFANKQKHGFELRFGKGRKLRLLSYAIYNNGICVVDHATTRADEIASGGILRRLEIERANYPKLPII